jgi:hypothetical protein
VSGCARVSRAMKAAVPKSCVTISRKTVPAIMQGGRKLLEKDRILSHLRSSQAARKIMTDHLASSEGWKLSEAGPRGIVSHLRAKFFSVPMPGMSTSMSIVIDMPMRYGVADLNQGCRVKL